MSAIRPVEDKLRSGRRLGPLDLAEARRHLGAASDLERIIAYEILLAASDDLAERAQTIRQIARECQLALETGANYPCNLPLVLRRIPDQELLATGTFLAFAIAASTQGTVGSRVNSLAILEKFAKNGNPTAKTALESALSDADDLVRLGAERAIDRLSAHGHDNSQ